MERMFGLRAIAAKSPVRRVGKDPISKTWSGLLQCRQLETVRLLKVQRVKVTHAFQGKHFLRHVASDLTDLAEYLQSVR